MKYKNCSTKNQTDLFNFGLYSKVLNGFARVSWRTESLLVLIYLEVLRGEE